MTTVGAERTANALQQARDKACWICGAPALSDDGLPLERLAPGATLTQVAHARCQPMADLARRSVYQAVGEKLGPNRAPVLHVRTGGPSTLLLCKNSSIGMRRVSNVSAAGGVVGFSSRADACAVCAREVELRVTHARARLT